MFFVYASRARKLISQGVLEANDAVSPQPALSVPAPAMPLLDYESNPPELEPGGWLTVQLLALRHPPLCSCCLAPTESSCRYRCGSLATVPIPLCDRCSKFYKGEKRWILLVAGTIGAIAGLFCAVALSLSTAGGLVLTPITTAAALIVGGYVASGQAGPASFSSYSASRNTLRIRFHNPAYVRVLLHAGRVT